MLKLNVTILSIFTCLLAIIILSLNIPIPAHASPLAGFTPTPVPPPNGGGGGGTRDSSNPGDDSDENTDIPVTVGLDSCNLSCSTASTETGDQLALANIDQTDQTSQAAATAVFFEAMPELLVPVQLVHLGSGFMVEGVLSDRQNTRFQLPYPGQWQVLTFAEPSFVTTDKIDTSHLNLAAVVQQLQTAPVPLGIIEADPNVVQQTNCPLCIVESATVGEPTQLPKTGDEFSQNSPPGRTLLWSGLIVTIVGLSILRFTHGKGSETS